MPFCDGCDLYVFDGGSCTCGASTCTPTVALACRMPPAKFEVTVADTDVKAKYRATVSPASTHHGPSTGASIIHHDMMDDAGACGWASIIHHVTSSDTLAGLSLHYGVSTQRIKETNRIVGSTSISMFATLVIPADDNTACIKRKPTDCVKRAGVAHTLQNLDSGDAAAVEHSLLLALRRDMGGSSTQEAAAYLNMADHKLGEALRMFKADKAWQGLAGGQ